MSENRTEAFFVQSLARGLSVIRSFNDEQPPQTLTQIASKTSLTRATVRRFLLTLVELGYVSFDGKYFQLTPQVLELGYSYLSSHPIDKLAYPIMKELSDEFGESVSISVLQDTDIVYIARIHTRSIMHVNISLGTRFPALMTSMGRILLSRLEEEELQEFIRQNPVKKLTNWTKTSEKALLEEITRVKQQGWSLVNQELDRNLRALAVPIHDSSGKIIAALNVSMRALDDLKNDEAQLFIQQVLQKLNFAADEISKIILKANIDLQ